MQDFSDFEDDMIFTAEFLAEMREKDEQIKREIQEGKIKPRPESSEAECVGCGS